MTATVPTRLGHPALLIRIGFWACTVIAAAVVVRRLLALISPNAGGPPQMQGLDATFASHAALTLAHIIPAMLFVLIAPLAVFSRWQRLRWPRPTLYPLGAITGLTAFAMSSYAVGGWLERSAVIVFNSFFLFSLARSFWLSRRGDAELSRLWLLRAVAVLLGIATTRPVMGVFFATSQVTGLQPAQFFGMAFWIGFSINVLIFEVWVRVRLGPRSHHI